jgi:ankyrin repeat protein
MNCRWYIVVMPNPNKLDIDLINTDWQTATVEDVKQHLQWGANPGVRLEDGRSALFGAASSTPYPDVIDLLLGNFVRKHPFKTLFRSIAGFTGQGCTVNNRNIFHGGDTALMRAARHNPNPDITSRLLTLGANVKQTDLRGYTALMCACEEKNVPAVVSVLIAAGSDVNKEGGEINLRWEGQDIPYRATPLSLINSNVCTAYIPKGDDRVRRIEQLLKNAGAHNRYRNPYDE